MKSLLRCLMTGAIIAWGSAYAVSAMADDELSNPDPSVKTSAADPLPNRGLGRAKAATSSISRRLADELEDRLLDYVDEFEDELRRVTFGDLDRDDVIEQLESEGKDADDIEQLSDALLDLDAVAVQRACRKLEMPTDKVEELVNRIDITSSFEDLKKKVEDGDSALAINRIARKLRRDLKTVDLQSGRRLGLLDIIELIVAGARVRDAVEGGTFRSLPQSAKVDWPIGQVPTVFYPRIPKGHVFVLGGVCLVAGADTTSDIEFAMKSVAEAMNLPVFVDVPAVPNQDPSITAKSGVVIRNPDDTGATITFKIGEEMTDNRNYNRNRSRSYQKPDFEVEDGKTLTLHPGEEAPAYSSKRYIEFSRGPKRDNAFYELASGTYIFFAHPERGWDIKPLKYEVTIDNSDNPNDFYYVVNGRRHLLAAGHDKTHSSSYPIVVRFDRGGGNETLTKVRDMTGSGAVWKVGVNIDTNCWDLFNVEDFPLIAD